MHDYLSTACHHDRHDRCRLTCKFCDVPCSCSCHTEKVYKKDGEQVVYEALIPRKVIETYGDEILAWLNMPHSHSCHSLVLTNGVQVDIVQRRRPNNVIRVQAEWASDQQAMIAWAKS